MSEIYTYLNYAVASLPLAVAAGYIIHSIRRKRKATINEIPDTSDNVSIVLEVPRVIRLRLSEEDLLEYVLEKRKEQQKELKEEEGENTLPTEDMIRKGLVKEG